MYHSRRYLFVVALSFTCLTAGQTYLRAQMEQASVTIRVSGLRSSKGKLEIRLWNAKEGFPKIDAKAFRRASVVIENGTGNATFTGIPYGDYAVSAFHDDYSNGKLDTKFPGIPVEGVGVSNDPHKRFGPPAFDSFRFAIREPAKTVPVIVEY